MADEQVKGASWLQGYRAFWVYTLARFALWGALWLILWLVGVPWLFAAIIGAVVSIPLSLVLLAKPRKAFAATIEARVDQRRERSVDLGKRLDRADAEDAGGDLPPGVSESPERNRAKRR